MDKKINARKKAQRLARQRKMRNRRIALTICLMIAVSLASIGGTLAWLQASTTPVVNTFTVGDINIDLYEHELKNGAFDAGADGQLGTEDDVLTRKGIGDYKIVPGNNLPKDPTAVVKANSEACWLFVTVDEDNWSNEKVAYKIAANWIELESAADENNSVKVYYREVAASTSDQSFNILADNEVTVSSELTKAEVKAMKEVGNPKLTFQAYAVQKDNLSAAQAWNVAQGLNP